MTLRSAMLVMVFVFAVPPMSFPGTSALAQQIYWTSPSEITRAELDGTDPTVLVSTHPHYALVGLTLDLAAGKMYWGQLDSNDPNGPGIRLANLDGSGAELFIQSTPDIISAIAWDFSRDKIYWAIEDGGGHGVWRANGDGTDAAHIHTSLRPEGLAIDVLGARLYFQDGRHLYRSDLDGRDIEDLHTESSSIVNIALDPAAGKLYWSHGNSISGSNLDGTEPIAILTGLADPRAIAVDAAGGKIYWGEQDTGWIMRADLDGTNVEPVVVTGASTYVRAMFLTANDCNDNGVNDDEDIASASSTDCNLNTVPDECEPDDDCNANGVPDFCDNLDGTSDDCNANLVPDECEPDCNINGVADECDITGGLSDDCNFDIVPDECQPLEDCNNNGVTDICDIGASLALDCNVNLRPDSCDIAGGSSPDGNANGIPDECEGSPMPDATFHIDGTVVACTTDADCLVGLAASSDVYCVPASGTCYVQRNRYLSIDPDPALAEVQPARRISLVLDGGATAVLGWVGEPVPLTNIVTIPPQLLSRIEADPHYRNWTLDNDGRPWEDWTVHVGDCETSPGHTYLIQSIPPGADILDEANYSESLELRTVTHSGDVTGSSIGQPPDALRNFKDITAVIRGFGGGQTEPRVWLDLRPFLPDFTNISFVDINGVVDGFKGESYPLGAPLDCPDQVNP